MRFTTKDTKGTKDFGKGQLKILESGFPQPFHASPSCSSCTSWCNRQPTGARRGAVLLIVVGLSVLILTVTLSYVSVVRSDADRVQAVLADAQARAMLDAARAYIAESSRIGWSVVDPTLRDESAKSSLASGAAPGHVAMETTGWNDPRNGALGPIPLQVMDAGGATITEPQTVGFVPSTGESTYRIGRGTGLWPDLGTSVRQALHVPTLPPYAVALAGNPVRFHLDRNAVPPEGGFWLDGGRSIHAEDLPHIPDGSIQDSGAFKIGGWHGHGRKNFVGGAWRFTAQRRPDPSPVASDIVDWNQGDPTPITGTARRCWFRVYRETPRDHDGDGTPWYDTVNLNGDAATPPNGSVFIITCGQGGTLGYRDWAEVQAAGAEALFGSAATFWDLRREETILWFRTEWSPFTQQNLAAEGALAFDDGPFAGKLGENHNRRAGVGPTFYTYLRTDIDFWEHFDRETDMVEAPYPCPFGSFLWTAALDREPPQW